MEYLDAETVDDIEAHVAELGGTGWAVVHEEAHDPIDRTITVLKRTEHGASAVLGTFRVPAAALRPNGVVAAASARKQAALAALGEATRAERDAIRAALDDGVTGYALAKTTGMSPQAIYKIRDGRR